MGKASQTWKFPFRNHWIILNEKRCILILLWKLCLFHSTKCDGLLCRFLCEMEFPYSVSIPIYSLLLARRTKTTHQTHERQLDMFLITAIFINPMWKHGKHIWAQTNNTIRPVKKQHCKRLLVLRFAHFRNIQTKEIINTCQYQVIHYWTEPFDGAGTRFEFNWVLVRYQHHSIYKLVTAHWIF